MLRKQILALTALAFVASATMYALAAEDSKPTAPARPSLDTIKQFVGDWYRVGDDGKVIEEVVSVIKPTAGGSAVIETLFPGSDHEMITMYIQEGEDLTLIHYCVMGNQPKLRAEFEGDPSRIVYRCLGGSNLKSENDGHMHEGRVRIVEKDRLKTEWKMFEGGNVTHTAAFELVRKR